MESKVLNLWNLVFHLFFVYFVLVGYSLLAINGEPVDGRKMGGKDIIDEILANEENYPISIK